MIELPKVFPAGVGEKVQYLTHDSNDNTVRFGLRYPGELRPEILKAAAAAIVNSVDVLHASFIPGNLGAYWHVNKDYAEDDYFTLISADGSMMETVCKAAARQIDPSDKTQLHCTLVQGDGECAIVLSISHLCVDGGDGKYLLYKLAEAYELIAKNGNADGLEVKNGSRATQQMYEELSPKDYFSILKPPLSKVKTAFPFPETAPGQPRIVTHSIPAAIMNAARKKAKTLDATANDLLLTASYRAYVQLPDIFAITAANTDTLAESAGNIAESAGDITENAGNVAENADNSANKLDKTGEAISIMSMMDLRRHCKNGESEGLCNMSGFMPTVLEHGVQGDFQETLSEISSQTRKIKENPLAGLDGMPLVHTAVMTTPLRLMLEVAERIYGSLSIGLTNLGNLNCEPLTLDGFRPTEGLFGGPLKKKPAMQISVASFDGTVVLSSVSECGEKDAEMLKKMLEEIEREVTAFSQSDC